MSSGIYGCDIGNGYSFISLTTRTGAEPVSMLPVGINGLNCKVGMPSEAFVKPPEGTEITVFDPQKGGAGRLIRKDPAHGVRAVKTRMTEQTIRLPDITAGISPFDIYGAITADLVRLGNLQRAKDGDQPIHRLVLTYPASFNNYQNGISLLNRMTEHVEAQTVDGHRLQVVSRIPEPAAVAVSYLDYLRNHAPEDQRISNSSFNALVYDLGHGTFDVAAVTADSDGSPFQIWATEGISDIGGKDFDERLLEEVISIMKRDHDYTITDEVDREVLRLEVIEAKHELSFSDEAVIQHQSHRDGTYMEITVSKARFEEICRDMIVRTLELTQQVLSDQQAKNRLPDAVVLSGGGSVMPMVREALEKLSPKLPVFLFRPSTAVSYGASIYAQSLEAAEMIDEVREGEEEQKPAAELYTRFGYGIMSECGKKLNGEIVMLLPAETKLPARSHCLLLLREGRTDIRVYKPRRESQEKVLDPSQAVSLVWLHFDIADTGYYTVELTVETDYNVSVAVRGTDDSMYQFRSTAENR